MHTIYLRGLKDAIENGDYVAAEECCRKGGNALAVMVIRDREKVVKNPENYNCGPDEYVKSMLAIRANINLDEVA